MNIITSILEKMSTISTPQRKFLMTLFTTMQPPPASASLLGNGSEQRIAFHVNASLTTLNCLKLEDRQQAPEGKEHVISIASWKIRKFNEHQLDRIISTLGFDLSAIKLHPHYEELKNYGAIAA